MTKSKIDLKRRKKETEKRGRGNEKPIKKRRKEAKEGRKNWSTKE